jgi:hypothetical protein
MIKSSIKIALFVFAFTLNSCTSTVNPWDSFVVPKVDLIIEAQDHAGVKSYIELVNAQGYTSIEDWVQNCCKVVAQEFYYSAIEANERNVLEITYRLKDGGALSYKSGAPPCIEVGFDLNYLIKFIDDHGLEAASDELYGILCHEISHAYQQEPKNAGEYKLDTEFFAFIEGSADLARLKTGGFNPPRLPKQGGSYLSGYNTTAFFYLWITNTMNKNFLRDLNLTAKEMKIWNFNNACLEIFNITADELWENYQLEIDKYPWISETNN